LVFVAITGDPGFEDLGLFEEQVAVGDYEAGESSGLDGAESIGDIGEICGICGESSEGGVGRESASDGFAECFEEVAGVGELVSGEGEADACGVESGGVFGSDVPMEEGFEWGIAGFVSGGNGGGFGEVEWQDEGSAEGGDFGESAIFATVAEDDEREAEFGGEAIGAEDELFVGGGDHDGHLCGDDGLKGGEGVVLFDGWESGVSFESDVGIAEPLGIEHCLSGESDGAHGAAGVTGAHAAGNGERDVLSDVAGDECGGRFAIGGGEQCTLAADDAISGSGELCDEALSSEGGGVSNGRLISDGQLWGDLSIPVAGGAIESVAGEFGFGVGVDEAGVDDASGE
jgi:hypothetical protein